MHRLRRWLAVASCLGTLGVLAPALGGPSTPPADPVAFGDVFRYQGVPMLWIEPDSGRIVDANEAAALLYGRSVVEPRQQHFQNINRLSERQVAEERQPDTLPQTQRKELWLLAAVMALGAVVAVLITAALGLRHRAQWATAQQQQAQQALQMREASLQHLARSAHGMQLALQGAGLGTWYWDLRLDRLQLDPPALQVLGHSAATLPTLHEYQRAASLAEQVFRHTHKAMLVTDAQGCIVRVNDAFGRLTGYAPDEVLGRNPSLLASGRHDRAFLPPCGTPCKRRATGRAKSGTAAATVR